MSSKNLDQYVDACRALRALEAAAQEDGKTESRADAIKDARYLVKSLRTHMKAREIWLADQILKQPAMSRS